jgi:hypothetical protein
VRRKLFFALLITGAVYASAQTEATDSTRQSIVDHITTVGRIDITMPDQLLERLQFDESQEDVKPVANKSGGYRIQVFSDNNARTAKSEARVRARNVSARFPQYPTYVVYSSPYWRLRVGNFRSQEEANAAAAHIKEAFPAYSKEIRVVRDRIVLSGE